MLCSNRRLTLTALTALCALVGALLMLTVPTLAQAESLIDGRQYQLVSPPNKGGAQVEALNEGAVQAAESGGAIAYLTTEPVTGVSAPEGNTELKSSVLSVRGSEGWGSRDIATGDASTLGVSLGGGREYRLFSSDLSLALVEQLAFVEEPPLLAPDASERTEYLRDDAPVPPGPGEATDYAHAKSNGEASATRGEVFGEPGYLPLLTTADTQPGVPFGTPCVTATFEPLRCTSRYGDNNVEGATPDLSHVVLHSLAGLTGQEGTTPAAEAKGAEGSLYELSEGGLLQLVSILPEGKQAGVPVPKTEEEFSSHLEGRGPVLGGPNAAGGNPTNARHAISSDGSRVIWTNDSHGAEAPPWSLYMRDVPRGETVRLDEAEPGVNPVPGSEPEAVFQTANANGSRVFFTDTQTLTADSTMDEQSAKHKEPDLYVCDMREEADGKLACNLKDLTVPVNAGEQADVQGEFTEPNNGVLLGASEEEGAEAEDGGYVYFVAKGVLSPANREGRAPIAGGYNLYVDDSSGSKWEPPVFIATLSGEDANDWAAQKGNLSTVTSRVSSNGRFLAFMSDRRLTGYDNLDASSPVGEPHADEEVFEYSAASGELACASCNPTSTQRPVGFFDTGLAPVALVDRRSLWSDRWLAGLVPGWTAMTSKRSVYQSRYLSDDGRLLFDSSDALVPADSSVGTENVYEFEPEGIGLQAAPCGSGVDSRREVFKPAHVYDVEEREGQQAASGEEPAGCVGLISSGESSDESAFMDASANGNDVFFITTSKLVKADFDDSYDMYDAHVCSTEAPCFPEETAVPPACTSGASCKPAPTPQPAIFGSPSSQTFSGAGNVPPPATTKPTVKKKTAAQLKAEKLAEALKACRVKRGKKRIDCERGARQRYEPSKAKKAKAKTRK